MEVAGLAIGVIPLVLECAKIACSVQRICWKVRGGFQEKRDELCKDINALLEKMDEFTKDPDPTNTTLKEDARLKMEADAKKLKSKLEEVEHALQSLVSKSWLKRTFTNYNIERGLDDALQLVACCERSFQTSGQTYLIKTSENIQNDVRNVATSNLTTENNTSLLIIQVTDLQARFKEMENMLRSQSTFNVKVRSFGSDIDRPYEVESTDSILHILQQMIDDNIDVKDIHFFSWSPKRHTRTQSGQWWRYRKQGVRLSTIKTQCGKNGNEDVEWRLDYVRSPNAFTLILVDGLQKEVGLLISHPVTTILEHLQAKCSGFCSIEECHDLEKGVEFDWRDVAALQNIMPYTCSLCFKLK